MQTRSSLQRRSNSESSDRVVAHIKPRPWGDETHEQPQTVQPRTSGFDFRNADWFSHDPGPRSPVRVFNTIQAKLKVGAPNDVYEQEADRVAEQVMSTPDSAIQQPIQREADSDSDDDELQMKPAATITPLVQREAMPEEEEALQTKALGNSIQREALPEEEEELQTKPLGNLIQRETMPEEEELQAKPIQREAMPEEEELQAKPIQREAMPEEEEVQAKSLDTTIQREAIPEEEEIQAKPSQFSVSNPQPSLETQLNSSKSGGSPLPDDVRSFMEPRFGADFSQVRVHTGSDSIQMNRELNAQAFTHKQDVYFGTGKAPAKDTLTAHELTHVVQQTGEIQTKAAASRVSLQAKHSICVAEGVQRFVGESIDAEPEGVGDFEESEPSLDSPTVDEDMLGVLQPPTQPPQEQPGIPPETDLPPPEQRRMIRMGSRGKEVVYAQERLNAHRAEPPLIVDGIFGSLTRKATLIYQNSHALDPDTIIGSKTWTSLDGPTVMGGSSGGAPGSGKTPNASSTLMYDTTPPSFSPPSKGMKMGDVRQQVKDKQTSKLPDVGATVNVAGVTTGGDEEIFVWNVLLQCAVRNRWGSEIDVVTEIGPPPSKGKAPVGQITVQIDAQGNTTATLLNRGAVAVPAKFKDIDEVKKKLFDDFQLASVDDGSSQWSKEELEKVYAAFSRLPASDRTALQGVKLVREQTLTHDGQDLAGLFKHEAQLPQGGTSASRSDTLSLADKAFASDNISFIGDKSNAAVGSFETILHEAGHAVEQKALFDAQFSTMEAMAEENQNIATLNTKIASLNNVMSAFNNEKSSAFQKVQSYTSPEKKACQGFLGAINKVTTALGAYSQNSTVSQHQNVEQKSNTAIQKRDAEKAKLNSKNPALTDFAATLNRQDEWFTAAQKRAKAHTDKEASTEKVKDRKAKEKKVSGSKNRSKRLDNFVGFVDKNKIPPLTDYAKKNWPKKPGEFFAEAYSLWLNDRTYLQANAQPLVTWFDNGEHLK